MVASRVLKNWGNPAHVLACFAFAPAVFCSFLPASGADAGSVCASGAKVVVNAAPGAGRELGRWRVLHVVAPG